MKRKGTKPLAPEIVEVDTKQLHQLLDRVEKGTLNDGDPELIRQVFESYTQFFALVAEKNTSIARLRKLLFGSTSEKSKDVIGDGEEESDDDDEPPADEPNQEDTKSDPLQQDPSQSSDEAPSPSPPALGHGRLSADDYPGAEQVKVLHDSLSAGDACPQCDGGKLYEKTPQVIVRIVGQAPLQGTVYRLQRLRCHLCGKVFTAAAPKDAGDVKYDATAASMIGLLKYGSGFPFNRLSGLQWNVQIPLPASTQWDVVKDAAFAMLPAYQELIWQAAQSDVLYNDDTTIRILALMGERRQQNLEDEESADRTGLFTSGIVATGAGYRIALFFSGRKHAGENLRDVLQLRAQQLPLPIQMCDALSRNFPQDLQTILSNCMVHARRQFVEIYDNFPDECRHLIEALKVVYRNDQVARQQEMSPEERLQYHQTHSQSTMESLKQWMQQRLDEKHVEPNSALGGAINYMLNHWDALTLFLRKPGAPLDNNICERALKKAILHRKNSLFYKTENGAFVGDLYMSLIYTCQLCTENPFTYLTELQLNADEVAAQPAQWMPWNYQQTLQAQQSAA